MTDREYLNMALALMHEGQWFGWKKDWTGSHRESYENIIVLTVQLQNQRKIKLMQRYKKLKMQKLQQLMQ